MDTNKSHKSVLVTLPQAAKEIGIQYRQLLEAAKAGEIPCYRLKSSRLLVSVSEVISCMKITNMEEMHDE